MKWLALDMGISLILIGEYPDGLSPDFKRILCRDRQNRVPPGALASDISIPDFR